MILSFVKWKSNGRNSTGSSDQPLTRLPRSKFENLRCKCFAVFAPQPPPPPPLPWVRSHHLTHCNCLLMSTVSSPSFSTASSLMPHKARFCCMLALTSRTAGPSQPCRMSRLEARVEYAPASHLLTKSNADCLFWLSARASIHFHYQTHLTLDPIWNKAKKEGCDNIHS